MSGEHASQEHIDIEAERAKRRANGAASDDPTEQAPSRLVVDGFETFIERDFPPREMLLSPWLSLQGLVMLYAMRGVGKTQLAIAIAYAIACGGRLMKWTAPKPAGVLYVDGEMPAVALQERLLAARKSFGCEPKAPLTIITPDMQGDHGIPDLATIQGQMAINAAVTPETRLVIIDNLSALVRSGKENEAEGWQVMQTWALRHRAAGLSVLFVHHAGKGGDQRGSSRREDVLDTSIALKRPSNYEAAQGARFEVHFTKARGFMGEDSAPFEAQLREDGSWSHKPLATVTRERVVELDAENMSQRDIASELGIALSTVNRHLRKHREAKVDAGKYRAASKGE